MTFFSLKHGVFRQLQWHACGMFADDKWSPCNTRGPYGIYIWTAGQWENPKSRSKFVWKWTNDHTISHNTVFTSHAMRYTNWRRGHPGTQPDNSGGHEACVNLWKKYGYTWNDEPCDRKYCFVCEDRTVPIWSPDCNVDDINWHAVRQPCSDFGHVTAPYKLSYHYYFYPWYI